MATFTIDTNAGPIVTVDRRERLVHSAAFKRGTLR